MTGIRRLGTIVITVWLAGCSVVDYAYNNSATFIADEIDDALNLDKSQLSHLETVLQQLLVWHRQQELVRYQQVLEQAAVDAADGITAAEYLDFHEAVRDAMRRTLERAIDGLGEFVLTLTPAQIEHYQRYYREDPTEHTLYLDMTDQKRENFRVEGYLEGLHKWFGDFDDSQLEMIIPLLQQLPDIYEPWGQYREAQQLALISVLGQKASAAEIRVRLKKVVSGADTDYARAFEPARLAYRQAYAEALEDISGVLSDRQIQVVVGKMQEYADIVARLRASNPG